MSEQTYCIGGLSRAELEALHTLLGRTGGEAEDMEEFGVDLWPLFDFIDDVLAGDVDVPYADHGPKGPNCRCEVVPDQPRIMTLGPDDLVVVEVPGWLSGFERKQINEALDGAFPDNERLVVTNGAKLRVIRRDP